MSWFNRQVYSCQCHGFDYLESGCKFLFVHLCISSCLVCSVNSSSCHSFLLLLSSIHLFLLTFHLQGYNFSLFYCCFYQYLDCSWHLALLWGCRLSGFHSFLLPQLPSHLFLFVFHFHWWGVILPSCCHWRLYIHSYWHSILYFWSAICPPSVQALLLLTLSKHSFVVVVHSHVWDGIHIHSMCSHWHFILGVVIFVCYCWIFSRETVAIHPSQVLWLTPL